MSEAIIPQEQVHLTAVVGRAVHQATIPIPRGYTKQQCTFYISINSTGYTGYPNEPIMQINASLVNSNVVQSQTRHAMNNRNPFSTSRYFNSSVNYLVIAKKNER